VGALGGITGATPAFPGAFVTIWSGAHGSDKYRQRAIYQPFISACNSWHWRLWRLPRQLTSCASSCSSMWPQLRPKRQTTDGARVCCQWNCAACGRNRPCQRIPAPVMAKARQPRPARGPVEGTNCVWSRLIGKTPG